MTAAQQKRPQRQQAAFTLIELLVVIGIIVILIAILLPVVASVRKSANMTATRNQISTIASACEAYFGDYHSYPGPFSENQIDLVNANNNWGIGGLTLTGPVPAMNNITSTENLVLGLSGGLSLTFQTGASAGLVSTFQYTPAAVGSGPQVLNTLISAQKQTTAYYTPTPAELAPTDPTTGYQAFNTAAVFPTDSVIPEYYDHIPGNVIGSGGGVTPNSNCPFGPILYLRARVSAPNLVNEPKLSSGYIPAGTAATGFQYNFNQLAAYGFTAVPNAASMGATNSLHLPDDTNDFPLPSPNPPASGGITYDAYTVYFANPAIWGQPKGKDAFLLIDAGTDRVFGTKDDIVYGN